MAYEEKNVDDFVTIGTSLPQGEDDELLPRKPIALHEQVVRDSQGRIRFHGAFTGGFSAGYFNSVDTKEGWAPKTFKSSRAVRKQEKNVQRPEDFMDEEDFGEFGIAPRKLLTNNKYRDDGPNVKKSWKLPEDQLNFSLFSNQQLQKCIEIAKITIGQKLLKKLGWRNLAQKDSKKENMNNIDEDFEGMFGCELPPGYDHQAKPKVEDVTAVDTRPGDICPIDFSIQYNMFGMGYTGLVASSKKKKEEVVARSRKSKGIKGHAFGVGALEDEDEDIYGGEKISNYDTILYTEDEIDGHTPSRKHSHEKKEKGVLTGFKKSLAPSLRTMTYPPPVIPRDFKLTHVHPDLQLSESSLQDQSSFCKDSFSRGELLGETPNISSVFELISEKDKIRIEAAKRKIERAKQNSSSDMKSKDEQDNRPRSLEAEDQLDQTPVNDSKKASHSAEVTKNIETAEKPEEVTIKTEWEKEQEKDRQETTSTITKQLHSAFFDRFTKGSEEGAYVEEKKNISEKEKSASLKLFGRLTRESVTWHPAKLLCVRFNVEDPYPDSSVAGLPTQKHSKQSIFDFFKPPETMSPMTVVVDNKEEKSAAKQENKKASAIKPLAVLATVDLRPSLSTTSTINLISSDAAQETQLLGDEKILDVSSEKQELEEEKEPSPPSMDIFKAIFEDTDDDDDDDDDEVEKTENQEMDVQSNPVMEETRSLINPVVEAQPAASEVLLGEKNSVLSEDKEEIKSAKKKHKKDKHKHKKEDKYKHSHKSKKHKKSKKYKSRREESSSGDDDSHDGDLSKVDKKLLLKLRELS